MFATKPIAKILSKKKRFHMLHTHNNNQYGHQNRAYQSNFLEVHGDRICNSYLNICSEKSESFRLSAFLLAYSEEEGRFLVI